MTDSPPTTPAEPWQPKAIVFDLLTALLNSWDAWAEATPTRSPAEDGRRWRERYLELTFGAGAYAEPDTAYETLVRRAAHDVGLAPDAPDALLLLLPGGGWSRLEPWPEAGRVLRALRSGSGSGSGRTSDLKLGVVTNCSAALGRLAVERVEARVPPDPNHPDGERGTTGTGEPGPGPGRGFRFDAAVTAEESGFYKPVAAAYEAVLARLGVDGDGGVMRAEDVLFVAGSAGDVQGATDAGMRVVWHNRVGLARKGDAVPLREGASLEDVLGDYL